MTKTFCLTLILGSMLAAGPARAQSTESGFVRADTIGLGENRSQGDLDQWAIQALQASDLEIQNARMYLTSAASTLRTLEQKAAGLRRTHPLLEAPLAVPDLQERWRDLAAAEALLANDPSEASRRAIEIQTHARMRVNVLDRFIRAGEELNAAEAELAHLKSQEHADAARKELRNASRSLFAARERYDRGARDYPGRLGDAKTAVAAARRQMAGARAMASFSLLLLYLFMAGLLIMGVTLHLRRRGVKREALELLGVWQMALKTRPPAVEAELERRVERFVGPVSGEGWRPWTGETLSLAEAIRADVGTLYLLWRSASGVLQLAEDLIRARELGAAYNFFLPGQYRKGIALLQHTPIAFDPEHGLPPLLESASVWRDDLLGDLAGYQPFRKTFQETLDELDLLASRATEALEILEVSALDGPSEFERTGERILGTAARENELLMASFLDGLFLVPSLFVKALPAAEAALAQARELFPTDPVAALSGDGARARRIADEAARLANVIAWARREILPGIEAALATFGQAAIATGWLLEERSRLSSHADLLAAQAAETPALTGIEELAQSLGLLGAHVERAVSLSEILGKKMRPEIHRVASLVQSAREELGPALSLPPDAVLREERADPSERLENATGQAARAHDSLGRGEMEEALAALTEAARFTVEAEGIVETTRRAFSAQAATVEERCTETFRIEALLPEHERILAGIRETFAASVLALRADDPKRPEANATLEDNLEEARAQVGLAHTKLDRAVAAFMDGKLLEAADLLRQVKRHQEIASHRLEEVAARRTRLDKAVASNRILLETLEHRKREDQVSIAGDPRIMRPTLDAFEKGSGRLEKGRQAVAAVPGDPLAAENELLAAKALLDDVHDRLAPADRALHAEARNSLEAAARQIATAVGLAEKAAADGILDSPQTTRALDEIKVLSDAHQRIRATLDIPHGDWKALDAEADRIAAEAARSAATLSGELAAAQTADEAISGASEWVRHAGVWYGDYGVTIQGDPGAATLSEAKSLLAQSRYEEAEKLARQALREATDAVAEAEAMVRHRRAEAQRRARRQRQVGVVKN